jgi:hypothetical protein
VSTFLSPSIVPELLSKTYDFISVILKEDYIFVKKANKNEIIKIFILKSKNK